jgi:hypothetical protein
MLSYCFIYAALLQNWCCQNQALFWVKMFSQKAGHVKKIHLASLLVGIYRILVIQHHYFPASVAP